MLLLVFSSPLHCATIVQVVVFAVAAAFVTAVGQPLVNLPAPAEVDDLWLSFKVQFNRNYTTPSAEETARRLTFADNLRFIVEHNRRYAADEVLFYMAINQYADQGHAEFRQTYIEPEW